MYTPCKLQCPWSSASDPPQSRWTDRGASLLVFWIMPSSVVQTGVKSPTVHSTR
jgi:hypothetical protein